MKREFKIGDRVISKRWGNGVVKVLNMSTSYPIVVHFPVLATVVNFTANGYYSVYPDPIRDIYHTRKKRFKTII